MRDKWTRLFVVLSVLSLFLLLYEADNQWFFGDDWGHWSIHRSGHRLTGARFWFADHNGHWMTLNRVVFEVVYRFVGLRSYLPYVFPVIVVHLAIAWLLRHLCVRAGVTPGLATAGAAVFLFLGTGAEVLVWADAFGFIAGLLLGGLQLVLSDRDGPPDRHDAAGVLVGSISMMSGAAAPTMLGVVALNALLTRRWRRLALHLGPPAALWLIWYGTYGHEYRQKLITRDLIGAAPDYFFGGVTTNIEAVTKFGLSGVIFAALLWFVAAQVSSGRVREHALAIALAAGLPVLWVQITLTRIGEGVPPAASLRYLYLGAFFVLPLLAVAADHLRRRVPTLSWPIVAIFVWSIASNSIAIDTYGRFTGGRAHHVRLGVHTVIALPRLDEVSADAVLVDPERIIMSGWVTRIEVLRDLQQHGAFGSVPQTDEHERLRWGVPLMVRIAPTMPAPCAGEAPRVIAGPRRDLVIENPHSVAVEIGVRVVSRRSPAEALDHTISVPPGATRLFVDLDDVDATIHPGSTRLCVAG